jgi:hypothetical protein
MPSYLIEGYLPRSRAAELSEAVARIREAAGELTAEGTPVRHVRSSFVPSYEPKTVEGHLTSIYAKLGVHSRTELARRL